MSHPKTAQQINSPQTGSVMVNPSDRPSDEYRIQLNAWTHAFGTTQLTHALAEREQLKKAQQQLTDLTACLEWADKNVWILQKFPKDGWHVAGHDLPMFPNLLSALKSAYENRDKTKE